MSAKLFQCQFLGYGWTNQSIHYMVFCRQKKPNKDLSWSKSEKVYTRLYLNKLSDALPTGHRAMANHTRKYRHWILRKYQLSTCYLLCEIHFAQRLHRYTATFTSTIRYPIFTDWHHRSHSIDCLQLTRYMPNDTLLLSNPRINTPGLTPRTTLFEFEAFLLF